MEISHKFSNQFGKQWISISRLITVAIWFLVLIIGSSFMHMAQAADRSLNATYAQMQLLGQSAKALQASIEAKAFYNAPYACVLADMPDVTADKSPLKSLVSTGQIDQHCAFRYTLKGSDSSVAGPLKNMTITFVPLAGIGSNFVGGSSNSIIGWYCELSNGSATSFDDAAGTAHNLFAISGNQTLAGCVVPSSAYAFAALS